MKPIRLLAVGDVERRLMDAVRSSLADEYGTRCSIDGQVIDPVSAYHPERNQYHSTDLIEKLTRLDGANQQQLLGITAVDLFIPILTFVFGEAQLAG